MIDIDQRTIELRQINGIKGQRPVIIDVCKGPYPYKGKYAVLFTEEYLNFYQLKSNYRYKGEKAIDFKIAYTDLVGYRFAFEKAYFKRITLIFKDELEFAFLFTCDHDEAGHNEANAMLLMGKLKEMKVFQKNNLKGGKREQRTISKADQLFIKEVRSPSKKRGLFW